MRFKSIVSLCLSVVILFSSALPVSADEQNNAYQFVDCSFQDFLILGLINGGASWPYGDLIQEIAGLVCDKVCSDSGDGFHHAYRYNLNGIDVGFHSGVGRYGVATCHYCGDQFKLYSSDLADAERGFVDGLDRTDASAGIAITGFSSSTIGSIESGLASKYRGAHNEVGYSYPFEMFSVLRSLGVNDKVMIIAQEQNSPFRLKGIYFDGSGCLRVGYFPNPLGACHATLYGVYALSSFDSYTCSTTEPVFYYKNSTKYSGDRIYYSKSYAEAKSDFLTSTCFAFDWDTIATPGSVDSCNELLLFSFHVKLSENSIWTGPSMSHFRSVVDSSAYHLQSGSVIWDNSRIVVAPTGTDCSSRPTSIMDVITQWNKDNPISTNSPTVNYYIMPSGGDDFYSPALYDEEELIYTDPVTGTEYLTNGWTYDYLTRCYTLDMADGFTIGDAAIDTIKLTYGDELLTVDHYSGSSLIRSDEYNYVMASGSECGLNGHSYTYETVKEPSCIAAGERKYTCSICGDEYAEEIPMGSHAYEYSVIKEASCISGGTTANTCRICGDQTVEHLPELGHDWQETGSTTTTYALPEGTSCPDCAGVDFAAAVDEAAGTYSCTCNGCGTVWTVSAVITYGVTTYTCSRCGTTKTETDDPESGLFDSIGNLIADGITWATDKLKQLVENLSGINDTFNDYADSVQENIGQYPALLGMIIALMPEDFMSVVWFGIVALVVLAVWKKWFS